MHVVMVVFTRADYLGPLTWRNVRALKVSNPISINASSKRMEITAHTPYWKLTLHGCYFVSLTLVVKPQQRLKSSIRFELEFKMADLQATAPVHNHREFVEFLC